MANKVIHPISQIKDKIFHAVDTINDPIRQTLSPRGGNVIYEDDRGQVNHTNDGVTIAKNISVKDPIERAIIDVIRYAALSTNTGAGDGTSTTVLWSSILVKEGLPLIENGWNPMELKHEYEDFADQMVDALKKQVKKVKSDKDLFYIANIAANNDSEIAENVVKTLKVSGEDGMVFIEPSNQRESEIKEDTGFNIASGMFTPELRNNSRAMSAVYLGIPVLITDKRLYYQQEAETILNTCMKNGYKEVVVVANDFIGEALPFFVTNHARGVIRVLLVKGPTDKQAGTTLEDLAIYLGGRVVSDKSGSIVDKLTIGDFVIAKRAFSDMRKTIISRDIEEPNKGLKTHITMLRGELKKLGDKKETPEVVTLKERLASLTTGMVTIRVGGETPIEVNEKIFRYEDAVNATRSAMKDGYLIGGGLAVFRAFQTLKYKRGLEKVYRKLGEASLRQIAENCGLSPDVVVENITNMGNHNIGFNAKTMYYDDLLECGVIDPFKVEELAIRNAVSVAGVIISSRYMILNEIEKNDKSDK